jgi:hypothetical protein
MPKVTTMRAMWKLVDAYTLDQQGKERDVNHLNEWGGMSRVLKMPVFTAWSDLTTYDKEARMTRALIADDNWDGRVGANNQARWVAHSFQNCSGQAAFFVIHAVDTGAKPRSVAEIESGRIFVGQLEREGNLTYLRAQPRPL